MKKHINWIAAIIFLAVCFVIGRITHPADEGIENIIVNENKEIVLNTMNWDVKGFAGSEETSDNPWGYTAGVIDSEEIGESILLNPGTATEIVLGTDKLIDFEYCIHPWVCDSSDGTYMIVRVFDSNGNELTKQEIAVDNSGNWMRNTMDLSSYPGSEYVNISCDNKDTENICDWLIIRQAGVNYANEGNESNYFDITYSDTIPDVDVKLIAESIKMTKEPVISQGEKESWESTDVLNPSVVMWNGKYYNYYSGWDGNTWRTGLAVSDDGINWTKKENPVLDIRSDGWDNTYIAANGSAIVYNDAVYYYYHGVNKTSMQPSIGLAISKDGENFTDRATDAVLKAGEEGSFDEAGVADPYVIEFGGKLYMYYLGMDRMGTQKLGVAYSVDGVNWVKNSANPIMDVGAAGAFDENGLGEPSVIYKAPYFYMLYTGRDKEENRNIGLAVSLDGIHFKKCNYEGIFNLSESEWADKVMCDTTLLELDNGKVAVWFGGGNVASTDENLNGQIGYFELELPELPDISGFDPAADYDENGFYNGTNIKSTDVLKGSYGIEKDNGNSYVWMRNESSMVLCKSADKRTLIIEGLLPVDMYKQAGKDKVGFTVSINGVEVFSKEYSESGTIYIEIPLEEIQAGYVEVRIKASDFVNGKNEGISGDVRNLSWIMNRMWME